MADDKQAKDDMESVLSAMSVNLDVSESSAPLEHPRYAQFKNYGTEKQKQKARRSDWLQRQQEGRDDKFNKRRSSSRLDADGKATSGIDAENTEMAVESKTQANRQREPSESSSMDANFKPGSWRRAMQRESYRRTRQDLKGCLMYSEWLIDVPEDFADNWIMIPAPKAKRVIIVLTKNMCELYNKAGQILNSFSIPQISSTALCDGFVIRNEVYLLDFMECGTFQQLHWCDYACRHMIGENFLKEHGILTGVNWPDKWKFNLLEPTGDCKKVTLEKFMAEPTPFQLDGLLFYHKNGHYSSGFTPLVGWLKPWMMTDILDVAVNPVYIEEAKGTTAKQFIDDFARDHSTYGKPFTREETACLQKDNMES